MEHIVVKGKKRLVGEVSINGAKNAALAIIPAAICSREICTIENLPDIEDISSFVDILTKLGAICEFKDKHTLVIDARGITNRCADFETVRKIRASYYIIGVLLGMFNKADVFMPGGCDFGTRPMDQHFKGFESLGASVTLEYGIVKASADKLVAANIYLDMASVGATLNIIFASIFAQGVTVIENAAKEPHIVDTANFLNMMGAKVKGAGTSLIKITGVKKLKGCTYTIIPDQIEAGTYMIAAAITGGDIKINNIIPKHMDSLTAKLREMNCTVIEGDDFIRVIADKPLQSANVKTVEYPGFPTDLQPQMTTLLAVANGTSMVTETVFENRFQYVNELVRMGANISVKARTATVQGASKLMGCSVKSTDLRAGAALVLAGLAAEGETVIGNIALINRGYEDIVDKLSLLGADIKIVDL